jgi:polysaccharide export outer membrane protein
MLRISLFFCVLVIVLNSCVSNKRVLYLQAGDVNPGKKNLPKDTVIRVHPLTLKEYRIQPLDNISVSFETLSDENNSFDFLMKLSTQGNRAGGSSSNTNVALNGILVNTEGDIEYAVLGKIHVAGLSIFQAQDTIRKVASQYIPNVIVRVRMLNFRYTLLGEVNGEKTVVSNNTRLTMMEAIGLAGGLNELADRANVKVIRQNGNQTEIFYVDLLKEQFLESPYYFVQQNDVIIVPPLRQRPFRRYFSNNLALITSTISFGLLIVTLFQLEK